MSQDYNEDGFDGFSDDNGSQVYFDEDDEETTNDHSNMFDDGESYDSTDDPFVEPRRYDRYLDDEASEAESDVESETDSNYESGDDATPRTLHKFMNLPLELRQMIWKRFCPDLSKEPRIYEIGFCGRWPTLAAWVEDQSLPLRTVLAVHQESRALAHKFAPDLIRLPSDHGVVPCDLTRDIVMVDWKFDHRYSPTNHEMEMLNRIAPGLQNLAVRAGVSFFDGGPDLDRLNSLKNVFVSQDTDRIPTRGLTWCLSDKTQSYQIVHQEEVGAGLLQEIDLLFYWPDPAKNGEEGERKFSSRSFGDLKLDEEGWPVNAEGDILRDSPSKAVNTSHWGYEIARLREWLDPLHKMVQPGEESWDEQSHSGSSVVETERQEIKKEEHMEKQDSKPLPQRISVWPIACFVSGDGVERIEAMKAWQKSWDEWESDAGSDDSREYWNEDDDPDSLDGFIAFDDIVEPEAEDEDEEASSQLVDEGADASHTAHHPDLGLDSGDEEQNSTEEGEPSRVRHRNRAVIDLDDSSDQEEETDEILALPHAGSSNRRARPRPVAIDSEDDDVLCDDEVPRQQSRARARNAVVSSSDEEEGEEDAVGPQQDKGSTIEDDETSSSSEEEDEEEEDVSDEETAPPPRMSLAKRLRLEAAQARAALAADESEDEENQDQDGGGGGSYDGEDAWDRDGVGLADDDEEDDEEAW